MPAVIETAERGSPNHVMTIISTSKLTPVASQFFPLPARPGVLLFFHPACAPTAPLSPRFDSAVVPLAYPRYGDRRSKTPERLRLSSTSSHHLTLRCGRGILSAGAMLSVACAAALQDARRHRFRFRRGRQGRPGWPTRIAVSSGFLKERGMLLRRGRQLVRRCRAWCRFLSRARRPWRPPFVRRYNYAVFVVEKCR